MRLCWAELCSVSLHQRSETAQWRDLQPWQYLLPLSGDSTGSHTHLHPHINSFILTLLLLLTYSVCLLVGQYLFMQGRIENIFTDELYSQFATEITGMLQLWRPKLPGGMITDTVISHHTQTICVTVFTIQDFQDFTACNVIVFFHSHYSHHVR